MFEGHTSDVMKVEWEPNDTTLFASCSSDRRVKVWDISKIGQEQKAEDAIDGPPELLVITECFGIESLMMINSLFMEDIEQRFLILVGM